MGSLRVKVIKPGMYSTLQDVGRIGYQSSGVPRSGAMSKLDASRANWLVGNNPKTPVIEITLLGPTIELFGQGQIALTGGEVDADLDGSPVPSLSTITVDGKHRLTIGALQSGCRTYLAIGGNWQVPSWLGSVSAAPIQADVLTPKSILYKGLEFEVITPKPVTKRRLQRTPIDYGPFNVLAGPEYHQISVPSIKDFLNRSFEIGQQSNRMGYRLLGPLNGYSSGLEVISSGIVPGTIQITNNGELIILMMDAQTSGGYPRLGNVIDADLARLAQYKPGDLVSFKLVSPAEVLVK